MFFWIVFASLVGIVMFGNLTEKIKDQDDFVVPVYEAMALSTLQQHAAAERGYLMALDAQPTETNAYLASFDNGDDGIVPLVTVEGGNMSGVNGADNIIYPYIESFLPANYKPQNNTRSYMFCVDKTQTAAIKCSAPNVVRYIVTLRLVPQRYETADKITALRSIARVSAHSRFFGMLNKAPEPLPEPLPPPEGKTQHQPIGAVYQILTAGVAPANMVYLPNYITCNFPMNDVADKVLKDALDSDPDRNYLVSLSLLSGLEKDENLPAGNSFCSL